MDEVGFRFHPYEEELINHYLKRKVLRSDTKVNQPIAEVNVLNFEPWDLPEFSAVKSNGPYWYFFSQLDYKYLNSTRANRTTKAGYWKATGKDREVKSRDTKKPIGSKKTLVFISKKVKNHSTKWVIHEYHVPEDVPNPNNYVICRLEKKADGEANTSTHVDDESSGQSASDIVLEGEVACLVDPPSQVDQLYDHQGLSYHDLPLQFSNGFSSNPASQADLEGPFYQDHGFSSDLLSQADPAEVNCYFELLSQLYPVQEASYLDFPLPNGFTSHCNVVQTPFGNIELEEDFSPFNSNLNNELVETISQKNLVVEGDQGLVWGAVGMSSALPPESISEISSIENGGMTAQAAEHVTAVDLSVKSSWNGRNGQADNSYKSFFISPDTPRHIIEDLFSSRH